MTKRGIAILKLGLISVAIYGATAIPLEAAETEMRGTEAAAIALAVGRFQAIKKYDLAHCTVTIRIHFFINSSTAVVIPTMPVRMVGSGTGANLLECRPGNSFPSFLNWAMFSGATAPI